MLWEEVSRMEKKNVVLKEKIGKAKAKSDAVLIMAGLLLANTGVAYATDIWTQGSSAAQDIYKKVVGISTPIAAASLVLLWIFRLFTHNQQNIDKSRTISKGIGITWLLINGLGYILVYAKAILGSGGAVNFGMLFMPYLNG